MADNISKYNASLSAAEKTERGRKAGKASGETRRENKLMRDRLREHITEAEINIIVDNLIERAKHNTRDFIVLRDTIGEKPTERLNVEHENTEITVRLVRNKHTANTQEA